MAVTAFPNGVSSFGVTVMPGLSVPFTGKHYFVDPVNGSDGNNGLSMERPFQTLYKGHAACTAGENDVVFLVGDGASTGTARLSLANAALVDSTVTTGTLVWSKNATHLVGITSPGRFGRARIAPPTGTYTVTTFGSANFVTVSGSGCYFSNLSVFCGFSTGSTTSIAWTDSGGRNTYNNVAFLGQNDATSAQATGSRSLKITGSSGEHTFVNCIIGGDTTTKTVANASLELDGGTPRNTFIKCVFPLQTSSADTHIILGTGNGCIDRWSTFEDCLFVNNIKSTSTACDDAISFSTASPGGMLLLSNCNTVGFTKIGDTNGLANTFVSNVGGAATDGLMLAPT